MDATIICIGDELLTGDINDLNSTWLARNLAEAGTVLKKIVVIPDIIDTIADEIANTHTDRVIITGGIGPTHDDVTRFGVAKAAGVQLVRMPDAVSIAERRHKLPPEAYVMADLPEGSVIIDNPVGNAPGFIVENRIYVFPGVPAELKAMFLLVKNDFSGQKMYVDWLISRKDEAEIVTVLNEAVHKFPGVAFGSYPSEIVKIKMKSYNPEEIRRAKDWLSTRI